MILSHQIDDRRVKKKYRAKRILRSLRSPGDAVLSRVVLHSVCTSISNVGCVFFVSCFLEDALFFAKHNDGLGKDICRSIRMCKCDIQNVVSNCMSTQLARAASFEAQRQKSREGKYR